MITAAAAIMVVVFLAFRMGRANWWVPGWLDRILPDLDPAPAPAAAERAS